MKNVLQKSAHGPGEQQDSSTKSARPLHGNKRAVNTALDNTSFKSAASTKKFSQLYRLDLLALSVFFLTTIAYVYTIFDIARFSASPECEINPDPPNFTCGIACQLHRLLSAECKSLPLNEVGDYFAGFFAPLTVMWFTIAFVWQARELSLQRREYMHSRLTAEQQLLEYQTRFEREKHQQEKDFSWQKAELARQQIAPINNALSNIKARLIEESVHLEARSNFVSGLLQTIEFLNNNKDVRLCDLKNKISSEIQKIAPHILLLSKLAEEALVAQLVPISSQDASILSKLALKLGAFNTFDNISNDFLQS